MKEKYDDFLIITKYKHFIIIVEEELINCPKKNHYFKDRIIFKLYDILKIIYETNIKLNKLDSIEQLLIEFKILDFLIKRSMDQGIICYKRFIFLGNNLNEIVRMCYGWRNSEKKKISI